MASSPHYNEPGNEGEFQDHPLFSLENIYRQYLRCRKNKRGTINALRFEVNCEKNLIDLQRVIAGMSYYPSRSVCFMATKPKLREIFAADFRDRIVHHVLVDYLERIPDKCKTEAAQIQSGVSTVTGCSMKDMCVI